MGQKSDQEDWRREATVRCRPSPRGARSPPPSPSPGGTSRLLIARRHSQTPYRERGTYDATDPVVAAVESFATANIGQPLHLADLAKAANVSPRTLARRFDVTVGMSPARYVQRLRVEAALALIRREGVALTKVADRVGFADASTLSRAVKRVTGQAPGAFRPPAGSAAAR